MGRHHRQRDVFLATEGDRYFRRNRMHRPDLDECAGADLLLRSLADLELSPASVLEVGSSDGWRLESMRRTWPAARCAGVDPSAEAISAGAERYPELDLRRGTADDLPFEDGSFDLVVLGFCLYLCDRSDLFRIAAEVDRVLAPRGHIAIYDFHASQPHRNPYTHSAEMASYKMDYARLFDWNPAYHSVLRRMFAYDGGEITDDNVVAVNVLGRDEERAWRERTP